MKPSILKRIFNRKTLTRLAFTVVVLATLVMVFYRVEAWRGERAWETYRKSAEARGVKLWLKDVVTPRIPDEQNFAAIPYFADRFGTPEQRKTVEAMLPQWSIQGYKPKRPKFGDLATGAILDVTAWRDYLVAAKVIQSATDDPSRDITDAFEKLPALRQIRAAASRPACRFPLDIEKGFAMEMPHISAIQQASSYFAVSAAARIAAKDGAGELDDCMQLFSLSDALLSDPFLINLLVRFSLLERVNVIIRDGLAAGLWKGDELTAIERKLSAQNLIAGFRFAMAGERASMTTEFDRLSRASTREIREMTATLGAANESDAIFAAGVALYPRGWMHLCKVKANELHDAFIADYAPVNGVEPEFIARRPENSLRAELQNLSTFDRYRYALVVMAMPVLDSVESSLFHAQARLTQVRIACALERVRIATGAFPESLDTVAAHFGGTMPKDFCDGKPMRYRRTSDGYELWSVALNRVDDGGTHSATEEDRKKQPDWLWKLVFNGK